MTISDTLQLIAAVLVADVLARSVETGLIWYRNRHKPECELCHKVRITRRTKDKKYWTCRQCRVAYYKENNL